MKKLRYIVAMSLDGYIAGPNGEYDWIPNDPEVDFAELWAQFDSFLMGRRTFEVASRRLGAFQGKNFAVVSRTLKPSEHPNITIFPDVSHDRIESLRAQANKDIWLFGGGDLFRTLLAMNEVDALEVSIIPVLLGGGVKLLPDTDHRAKLELKAHRIYQSRVTLTYEVQKQRS